MSPIEPEDSDVPLPTSPAPYLSRSLRCLSFAQKSPIAFGVVGEELDAKEDTNDGSREFEC